MLLVIFDPTTPEERPRFERTRDGVKTWLTAQPHPEAFRVHMHRVSDDVDTTLAIINGEFTWPDPIRAWKGTRRNVNRTIEIDPPRSGAVDPGDADRLTLAAERRMGC
jgi:hypothetical protein